MKDEDIICTCMSVSVKDIRQAIDEGARTVQEVQDKTGAGTVCGLCLIKERTLKKNLLKGS